MSPSRDKFRRVNFLFALVIGRLVTMVFYIRLVGGASLFTFEPRVAARWAALGATVIENPVDDEGDAFTGAPNQHLATSVDELGGLSINVVQHVDAAAAAVAAASTEEPPRAEVVISVAGGLEVLTDRVAVLEAEKEALEARLGVLEAQGTALLAWAVTLST